MIHPAPIQARRVALIAALLASGSASAAMAQGYDPAAVTYNSAPAAGPSPNTVDEAKPARRDRSDRRVSRDDRRAGRDGPRVDIVPYLEVNQILTADLKNGGDVLTYTSAAAGVEASIATRRAELAASVRYERRIAWDDDIEDQDVISGILRGRYELARGFNVEAGALATRTRADVRGSGQTINTGDGSNRADVYSVYAGPTLAQTVAGVDVGAGYRFGYTKVEVDDALRVPIGGVPVDVFDSSTNHALWGSIGQRPGNALPFGWQLSGGWDREDASQLDQRYDGKYARADATLPVGRSLSLIGGVGYEKIEISQRDAVRDAAGLPVLGPGGRFVTDPASPRVLAFETDGLIWDVGVMWQPSNRTSFTARVGRRYGDMNYTGSLTYRPNHALQLQVGVYDGLSSFGRSLSGGLAALPTQFDAVRNPLDGELGGCVFGNQGGGCLNPALGAATAAQFRSRGVQAVLSSRIGAWAVGLGGGYDRRRILAPELAGLFSINGTVEENWYGFVSAARPIDARSDISTTAFINVFDNGLPGASDVTSAGATGVYSRRFGRSLTGSAALGINTFDADGVNRELLGSALLGLRYSFR